MQWGSLSSLLARALLSFVNLQKNGTNLFCTIPIFCIGIEHIDTMCGIQLTDFRNYNSSQLGHNCI